ncbi:hypothetical protein, partial [Aeromonas caviae]
LHAETALGTGRMTSTFECSKKWGDYRLLFQIRTEIPVIFIPLWLARLAASTICPPVWWQAKE